MKRILFLILGLAFICGTLFSSNDKFVIVIDAGHGGRDPGALRGEIKEKNINLAVAIELGKLIEKNLSDVKVVYTRKTDSFISLDQRTDLANKNKANLFISIHTNSTAATTTRAQGADTYILGLARSAENLAVAKRENAVIKYEEDYTSKYEGFDPDSPESYIIFEFMTNQYMQQSLDVASYIQADIKKSAKRVDRGVRQAGFLVLRESGMPSLLIELGFINNPTEAKYLASSTGQREMATAIYTGFKKYKEEFDKKAGGAPSKASAPMIATQSTTNSNKAETLPSSNVAEGNQTEYRVQFLYSVNRLSERSPLFKGVAPTGYTEDSGYKYYKGSTTDYDEILRVYNQVRQTFSDAFIVRLSGSERNVVNPNQKVQSQTVVAVDTSIRPEKIKVETMSTPVVGTVPSGAIEYRVQFLYSPTKIEDNSLKFKGLEGVSYYIDNGYKYTLGSTTDYNEIRRIFNQVKNKFSDAFIIKMRDGKRI